MTATLDRPVKAAGASPSEPAEPAEPVEQRRSPAIPPLSPRLALLRGIFVTVAVLALASLLHLLLISRLEQSAAQQQHFDDFREALANGTAPIGPADFDGDPYPLGTPVARIQIAEIGLDQIVLEGTTATVLADGPGHRRDTPLPGQAGTSRLFGKRTTAGAVFGRIGELTIGDEIVVTTQQGTFDFRVIATRVEGDPITPRATAETARITLATADGPWWAPSGILRVDADLDDGAVGGPARLVTSEGLPAAERPNSGDPSELWILAFLLQLLLVLAVGMVWAWHRWGRPHAWITFVPPLLVVSSLASAEASRLLPSLL